jgi:hypothetical protein
MTMGSDITAHRMSIGMFYARAYSPLLKRYPRTNKSSKNRVNWILIVNGE